MKLDMMLGPHWILDFVMGTIEGTIVWFCILFLAISWPGGSLGAPANVVPLLNQYLATDLDGQQTSTNNYKYYTKSSASQNPSYESPLRTSLTSGENSEAQKQQLLNQVSILLKQLSPSVPVDNSANIDTPCGYAIENQEKNLLQNLVNRLEALKRNGVVVANPSPRVPAISEADHNSIFNQCSEIRLLTLNLLPPRDAQIVLSALDDLYKTFVEIITGQLVNVELPNLCNKILALNAQLKATDAPQELQDAVTDFSTSLTLVLTGQSQVTILGLCDCLNDLETAIVTVIENDKSRKLQFLLSNLVDAVTNAVASGGDVGCNVIDIVQRYVTNIKQAVQEDANVRAGKIYSSVLNFEEELYKILFASNPTAVVVTPPNQDKPSSNLETEKDYLTKIGQLSKGIFGDRTDLVKAAVKILLDIKQFEDPSPEDESTSPDQSEATIANLKKVYDLLKSVKPYPQTDSTYVIKALAELLSDLPDADAEKVLDALDPISEDDKDTDTLDDATAIVSNGELFIIKERLVRQTDPRGNVINIAQSGQYKLVDPKTNVSWSGDFAVRDGTIQSDDDGNIYVKNSGVYNVNLPDSDSSISAPLRVKRQGNFELEDNVVVQVDENGNSEVTESGTYSLLDPTALTMKSGTFEVENSVAKLNPDGSIDVIKSGLLYVNEPDATSPGKQPSVKGDYGYFLFDDHIFEDTDSKGNYGSGIYNLKNPKTDKYQSGTYVIQELTSTENPDGSMDSKTSGVIYVDNLHPNSPPDNTDGILIIRNGSQFTFDDHVTYVTDKYGHVTPISTGEFTQTDPTSGITTLGSYAVQNMITTDNPDGSMDITKFGRFFNIRYLASSSSSEPAGEPTSHSAKHFPITKDSFDALINSLIPVKHVQPSKPQSPSKDDQTYDATSIVRDGTTFIISELITPQLDPSGNVIDKTVMGTYHLMDNRKNTSWSGAFDVEESVVQKTISGQIELTASGRFDVTPCEDDYESTITGSFSIKDRLSVNTDESGTARTSQGGRYSLTDSTTGASKSGTFVVENTVSRSQPDGGVELVKSGLLYVDKPHATSSYPTQQPLVPGYDGYFLFDNRIFDSPDSDGNCGDGVYSIKDPRTNEYSSGTYVIQQTSTTNNPDGTVDTKTKGVIYVDGFDPDSNCGSTASPSIIKNGAPFTCEDHLVYVTDTYGHVSLIGKARYTQIDPDTGLTQSESHVILNTVTTEGSDGSTYVRKFGVFPIVGDRDSSDDTSNTESKPTVSNPSKTFVLKKDYFEALVNSLSPINPATQNSPLTSPLHTPKTQGYFPGKNLPALTGTANGGIIATGTSGNPIYDASAIVKNGASFIIDRHVVSQQDDEGNSVGLFETGSYSIRDSQTNGVWTGCFDVEDYSIRSTTGGQTVVTSTGIFDVNLPDTSSTTNPKNNGIFSIEDNLNVNVDETGTSTATEDGTYSLTDSNTGDSTSGTFVVENAVSKVNPDGSIDVVKSGTLYVDGASGTSPKQQPPLIKCGGYFLTDQNLLAVPDRNGNYGTGVYNIKDPQTNEYTSGTYVIQKVSTVNNDDGTIDVTTSGLIYVDRSRSSTSSPSSDPALAIINGAQFVFDDHLHYVTDPYGQLNIVGTGVFTQTDPKTKTTRSGKYKIQDIINTDNADGSQRGIQSGFFYYDVDPLDATTDSDTTIGDLKVSLQALFNSLDALKTPTNNKPSLEPTVSKITATPTSGLTPPLVTGTGLASDYVVLPRSNVISAISRQCLSPGDVVVVQANNGAVLLAKIQDSYSPVTFHVANLADLTGIFAAAKNVWTVQENDFSKQDRSLFDAVLKSANSPCNS